MARALCFLLLIVLAARSWGLRLLDTRVPQHGDLYKTATMSCNFALDGARLYSVKWYKDDFEFFRYMPDSSPHALALPLPAVTVDLEASNMTSITLTHLQFKSSGVYRCEVSTEAPNFVTVVGSGNMSVIALPHDGPMIEGVLPTYIVGSYVKANCSSSHSYPPATITWYINGIKVEPWYVANQSQQQGPDKDGLYSSWASLWFQLDRRHFRKPDNAVELRCSAKVAGHFWDRTVRPVLADPSNQKLAQERLSNHGAVVSFERALPICVVLVLVSAYWS